MAATSASKHGNGPAGTVPQSQTFAVSANGELSIPLEPKQWRWIAQALTIASTQAMRDDNIDSMFEYSSLCGLVGTRLGPLLGTAAGESPPLTRAAAV